MSLHGCHDGHHHPLQNLNSVVQAFTGVFFTKSLMPQRSPIIPADAVHCCHGALQCFLQTLCPVDTAVIVVFCSIFFCHSSLLASPAEPLRRRHGCYRRLLQTLPRHLSESPANTLLPDPSPATSVDFLHDYHKFVNIYCRLCAILQPARQCLLQTFCCSRRHRCFLQIMCNAPTCSSVSPADILLQQMSPVLPADLFNLLPQHSAMHPSGSSHCWHGTPRCTWCAHCLPANGGPPCLLHTLNCC